jgi:AAA15 family ATPase/GTPase
MKLQYIFYVGTALSEDVDYPCFYLSKTKWDDYGFSTSFSLYYVEEFGNRALIGSVKIASVGQTGGRTSLPIDFSHLEPGYFSLGQSESYYKNLDELGNSIKAYVLKSLKDVTSSKEIMHIAEKEKAYNFSLVRFLGPLEIAGLKTQNDENLSFEFESFVHSSDVSTQCAFNFKKDALIPNRINALIGVNGAGKTQLLANFVGGILGMSEEKIEVSGRQSISKVIVVSYSVFDRFFLPDQIAIPANRKRHEYISKNLKYVYIGLREKTAAKKTPSSEKNKKTEPTKDLTKIAGPIAFSRRFTNALQKLRDDDRYEKWKEVMKPILAEADFIIDENEAESTSRARFRRLGAGHKATLSMLTSLFSELQDDSLVVIDEPENHLHPTLLSTMLHVLRKMLEISKSFAVISTHSPVVIQEIPAKYVQVLAKVNGHAQLIPLRKESFGTSIDTLTSEIFRLTYQMPSYINILSDLARRKIPLEEIEEELGAPLSVEARSFYISMMGK